MTSGAASRAMKLPETSADPRRPGSPERGPFRRPAKLPTFPDIAGNTRTGFKEVMQFPRTSRRGCGWREQAFSWTGGLNAPFIPHFVQKRFLRTEFRAWFPRSLASVHSLYGKTDIWE